MNKEKLAIMVLVTILVLVIVGVVSVWVIEGDFNTVFFEVKEGNNVHFEKYPDWIQVEGTKVSDEIYKCEWPMSARAYISVTDYGNIRVRAACFEVTPIP